jgi:acid phosphatase
LELSSDNKSNWYVKMIYNGEPLELPACQGSNNHYQGDAAICTLSAFMKRVNYMSLTPTEYELACKDD